MRNVRYATDDASLLACSDAIFALRPHLQPENLLPQLKEMQEQGYRIVYLTADEDPSKVVAIAGFRYMHTLHAGKTIYIDDLSTLSEYRGKGYASLLLYHIKERAREEGLQAVQLDSGHARHTAHRLYLQQGYHISAHHFVQPL
ncbi:MAG TPA: GNAT family N-acetyltransferase [Chitinophaga sp.]|uniref:GNAT family N-acetyltransferase n=1 Tax=Chitinophaga sp. TaxID=1869181 RepID=UPI002B733E91|nr:GNAT family N-acetyltransferase [Chitinophaga sp.]HVI47771.1 GNAT family N-acetyltransferase [Chitinophaga sp.]